MQLNWTDETKKMFPNAYKYAMENPDIFDELAEQREAGTLPEEPEEGVDLNTGTMAFVFNKKREGVENEETENTHE